jgi:PKD repeat protein
VRTRLLPTFFLLLCFSLQPRSADGQEAGEGADADHPSERAEWNAMFRQDRDGLLRSENRLQALREACDIPIDPSMPQTPPGGHTRSEFGPSLAGTLTFPGTIWQSIGPQPIQAMAGSDRAWGNVAGRVSSIALHPTNPSILLLGSASGGIWKSTDAGLSWRPVSDTAPSLAISSIAFSPSSSAIVYATTGELDSASHESSAKSSLGTYLGAGLLKSSDGGETWIRSDVNLPSNAVFARVVVQPTNAQNVLVAVYAYFGIPTGYYYGGIYRSTDGGVHFASVFQGLITDLAQDPNDANTAFLAAANANCTGCPDAGIWVSHDFGLTWAKMFTNSSPVSHVKLGVSRVAPTALYASFLNSDKQHTGTGGIFWSTDAGAHWSPASADSAMCPAPPASNQCNYDHWIAPDPTNPQIVYFGSIDLYKSTSGGGSWQKLTNNYNASMGAAPVHPDQHAAAIVPTSPGTIYFGNDGGVYRSTDGGLTFQNLNATLALGQFNNVVPHPQNADEAMGGTQDNGNVQFTGQPLWTDRTSGDGGFNLIRRDIPAQRLVANYYAFMRSSVDGGSTYQGATACGVLMDCTNSKPLPADPMAFYPPAVAAPGAASTVFFGTNRVWKNTTFGATASAWSAMSTGAISSDVLTTLDTVGDGSGAFWAGGRNGDVLFSSDGGATFSMRTGGLPTAVVTKLLAATADGRGAYVVFGGFLGSPSRHVFRTSDAGLTWTNISGNLPDVPVTALAIDPTDPAGLFVGTDVGVFRSANGGSSWTSFNQGLPNASVYGLAFSAATGDLYAATFGRGVFRIRAASVPPAPGFSFSPAAPVVGQSIQFTDSSSGAPTSWAWTFGDGTTSAAQNPTKSYTAPGSYTVTLTASNGFGSAGVSHTVAVGAAALPNLTPYKPSSWSGKIVVARAPGQIVDGTALAPADHLYVSWAVVNAGNAPALAAFFTELYVDGVLRQTWRSDPPLNVNFYAYVNDYSIGSLPAGSHTIRIKTDSTSAVAESNEADNDLTRTIAVSATECFRCPVIVPFR